MLGWARVGEGSLESRSITGPEAVTHVHVCLGSAELLDGMLSSLEIRITESDGSFRGWPTVLGELIMQRLHEWGVWAMKWQL